MRNTVSDYQAIEKEKGIITSVAMKKIRLIHITPSDKSSILTKQRTHSISLGNGKTFYFKNIKEAKAFLTNTNRFLNFQLFYLNETMIEIRTIYHRNWFYFPLETSGSIEGFIIDHFQRIDKWFTLLVTRSHFQNGNHFVFKHMFNICDSIDEIASILKNLQQKRGNYAEAQVIEVLREKLSYCVKSLNTFGDQTL